MFTIGASYYCDAFSALASTGIKFPGRMVYRKERQPCACGSGITSSDDNAATIATTKSKIGKASAEKDLER